MRHFILFACTLLVAAAPAAASDWPDATPTAWHQLARAESLLSAPEPPNPVAVCIVDSGVNLTPDLAPAVIERLAYDGGDPGDTYPQEGIDDGHGTYVATFLAGQVNGWGGAGLWPRAKVVSVRVFPPGAKRATVSAYLRGLKHCRHATEASVINLSLGDVDGTENEFAELRNRITDLRTNNDVNVVAAVGNRGAEIDVPASYPAAFAVGAIDADMSICSFSARGPEMDLLAPGCDLQGADQQGHRAAFNGTSFAAPMVTATIAALRSYAGVSAAKAEEVVLATARPGPNGPVLDVAAALHRVGLVWPSSSTETPRPSTSGEQMPMKSGFIDYPRPRLRLQAIGRARYYIARVSNRPRSASVQVRTARRTLEFNRSSFRLRVRRGVAQIEIRFLGDEGSSAWIRRSVPH